MDPVLPSPMPQGGGRGERSPPVLSAPLHLMGKWEHTVSSPLDTCAVVPCKGGHSLPCPLKKEGRRLPMYSHPLELLQAAVKEGEAAQRIWGAASLLGTLDNCLGLVDG